MLKAFYYLQNFFGKAGLWPGDVEVIFRFKGAHGLEQAKMEIQSEMTWVQLNNTFKNPAAELVQGHCYGVPFRLEVRQPDVPYTLEEARAIRDDWR